MIETGRNQTTAPATEPVTLAEAKVHLREDGTAQNDWITASIVAAREQVEKLTWRALVTQVWDIYYSDFPVGGEPFRLPLPPLQSVDAITYVDTDGTTQTLASGNYQVDEYAEPAVVRAAYNTSWPEVRDETLKAVKVTITAGYGAAADVPDRYKQAIYLLVGHWYANRESVVVGTISKELEQTVKYLLGVDHARAMIG